MKKYLSSPFHFFITLTILTVLFFAVCNKFLRPTLIMGNSLLYALTDTSGHPNILKGKYGWFYFNINRVGVEITKDYQGLTPFSKEEVAAKVKRLEMMQAYLAERNIQMLFVVAPEKQFIYPEFMPSGYRQLSQVSRTDQLMSYLRSSESSLNFLDLRPVVLKAKQQNPDEKLYYKLDSHWTSYGAYAGYKNIMQALDKIYLKRDALTTKTGPSNYKDLPSMLYIDWLYNENTDEIIPAIPEDFEKLTYGEGRQEVEQYKMQDMANHPEHLMVYYDSFTNAMRPFLNNSFAQTTYVRHNHNPDLSLIDVYNPDIVIYMMVSRGLKYI